MGLGLNAAQNAFYMAHATPSTAAIPSSLPLTQLPGPADPAALRSLIEEGIAALPFAHKTPTRLYQPLAYILGLKGKRLRPMLVLLTYQAYTKSSPNACLQTALAVELFHNFTLLHDDIMDNAPTRRGEPTVHVKWDENVAILAGDALFAHTHGMIAEEFPALAAQLIQLYTRFALEVCEGQMEDMDLAAQPHATVDAYVAMIEKKTAALLGGALRLGALAAGAPTADQEILEAFGRHAGIGFQLQDDYLDAFADEETFGKKAGGDIIENKKTYLWLQAYAKANATQRAELDRWAATTGHDDSKVAAVLALYSELGIDTDTRAYAHHWFERAERELQSLSNPVAIASVRGLLDELRVRQH